MVKIIGNEIWRSGEKIGWVEDDHIRDRAGKRLGYFRDRFVYDMDDHKIAYIEQDYLISQGSGSEAKIRLNEVAENIEGGVLSEIGKCAVYVLLGIESRLFKVTSHFVMLSPVLAGRSILSAKRKDSSPCSE